MSIGEYTMQKLISLGIICIGTLMGYAQTYAGDCSGTTLLQNAARAAYQFGYTEYSTMLANYGPDDNRTQQAYTVLNAAYSCQSGCNNNEERLALELARRFYYMEYTSGRDPQNAYVSFVNMEKCLAGINETPGTGGRDESDGPTRNYMGKIINLCQPGSPNDGKIWLRDRHLRWYHYSAQGEATYWFSGSKGGCGGSMY
jgi:hypothetical protein